jgi:hypothetical protein
MKELADYTCNDNKIHWLFCGKCGVRCFLLSTRDNDGQGSIVEKKVPIWKADEKKFEGEEMRKVWLPGKEGKWIEGVFQGYYLSVNANTLEAGQEGLDLRTWTEDKVVSYLDCLNEVGEDRYDRPHEGGVY